MEKVWTIRRLLEWTIPYLEGLGLERPRFDSEMLLACALGKDRLWLYTHYDQPLTPPELAKYRSAVIRRSRREPLQYILGHWGFWSLEFAVGPGVLIPRQETEHLVEFALTRARPGHCILDVCTGSGNVAVCLAKEVPSASLWATDISGQAIELAKENARIHNVLERIHFAVGDLFEPVSAQGTCFDLVVCNPPYIPSGDIDGLQPEISRFEPRAAVDGGIDGLAFYRRLVPDAIAFLKPTGWLVVEIGTDQAPSVREMLAAWRYREIEVVKDYSGQERVVAGIRPGKM
ncbi:MAG: peptide chain release factor N(5)-glutamine methyltransferase [bacterium]